jgi:hypothetical protein
VVCDIRGKGKYETNEKILGFFVCFVIFRLFRIFSSALEKSHPRLNMGLPAFPVIG